MWNFLRRSTDFWYYVGMVVILYITALVGHLLAPDVTSLLYMHVVFVAFAGPVIVICALVLSRDFRREQIYRRLEKQGLGEFIPETPGKQFELGSLKIFASPLAREVRCGLRASHCLIVDYREERLASWIIRLVAKGNGIVRQTTTVYFPIDNGDLGPPEFVPGKKWSPSKITEAILRAG